ncbi:MAG TPA: protease complex subunit PrcB family protein [Pyrinomonadaceae bacterium]
MLSVKAVVLVLSLSFALNGVDACDGKKGGSVQNSNQPGNVSAPVNRQPDKPDAGGVKDDLKQLAQGQHSAIRNAFIAVARDAETYAALRKVVNNLPDVDKDFFKSNLVLAAFLGERRTGGYGVRFMRAGDGSVRVEETTPPKDAMSAQVITYPFSVVAVPARNQESVAVEPGNAWRAMTRPYQVKDGEFTMSGGITGRSEKFGITGNIGVMREGNLATFLFDLQSKGGAKQRALKDVATGLVQAERRIAISSLGAGSFVDPPADALRATGLFAETERGFSLTFESIPSEVIADGFNGRGTLNAEATAPGPVERNRSSEDDPQ